MKRTWRNKQVTMQLIYDCVRQYQKRGDGATAYQVANHVRITPQYANECLKRMCDGGGVGFMVKKHRPGVDKRVWFATGNRVDYRGEKCTS